MSRIVDLTVNLKLELADRLGRTEFTNDLESMLRSGLGDVLTPYSDCVTESCSSRATRLRSLVVAIS